MLREAFMAGIWSAFGSTLGKLSGTPTVVGDSYFLWSFFLALMLLVNTWSCRCYLHSLDAASNSVSPTVISSASSYILSGILGVVIFKETSSFQWWIGTALIIQGLALIARQHK
ncbi:unnamed protein product, partial [Brenthis ino]